MKFSQLFGRSFTRRSKPNTKPSMGMSQKDLEGTKAQSPQKCSSSGLKGIEWELRPGGLLVQKREPSVDITGSMLIKVKVSHGHYQHDITISAQATFGDLKRLLAQEVSLQPHEQRLLFRGKEKEDKEYLHISGVEDTAKIILVDDPACKERKLEEIKMNMKVHKACYLVQQVGTEVDKLAGQIAALEEVVGSGSKVTDRDFRMLSGLLMRQLMRLHNIDAEGEAKAHLRIEARRVQNFVEHVDNLKACNSSPICSSTSVVMTTQWETFDSGLGSLTAPPVPSGPSIITTNWEVFN